LYNTLLKYDNARPSDILLNRLGKVVIVEIKGGNNLRGRLMSFDQHLNLFLGDTREITISGNVKSLGFVLLRGDNVVLILPNIVEMAF
jgi:small nuclear ribonucleoprotein